MQEAPGDPRRRTNAGSVDNSVTGQTSVAAVETAETEVETLTDAETTRGIAADRLPGTTVDAIVEAIREKLRDARDAASFASREDTSKLIALRKAAMVVETLETQETTAMVVTDAETKEVVVATAETHLAAITQGVARLPVTEEVTGTTTAHPLGTERTTAQGLEVLPNTVVMIGTTAEAPLTTTNERCGTMHKNTKKVGY